jgi:hypothetical protein
MKLALFNSTQEEIFSSMYLSSTLINSNTHLEFIGDQDIASAEHKRLQIIKYRMYINLIGELTSMEFPPEATKGIFLQIDTASEGPLRTKPYQFMNMEIEGDTISIPIEGDSDEDGPRIIHILDIKSILIGIDK